jgi:hypothetical protein
MSKLCSVCSTIFSDGSSETYGQKVSTESSHWSPFFAHISDECTWFPLHESRKSLEQGLSLGCEICRCMESRAPRGSSDFQTSFFFSPEKATPLELWIVECSGSGGVMLRENALRFHIWPVDISPDTVSLHQSAIAASKSDYTGSSEWLYLASRWLAECTTHHKHCSRLSKPAWYPKRLLQILDHTVDLITTAECDMRGPYFTLSHCWGGAPPELMLTLNTVAALEEGVEIASLEHTYRDALIATRSLGVRYLWIDLFCIFQGQDRASVQDWATESITMDQVYAGSLLNISASHGRDGNTGCFTHLSHIATSPSIIVPWAKFEGAEPAYYELAEDSALRGETDLLSTFYRTLNVFKRGWIVQERILASRVLHFASKTLVWECCEGVATQRRPHVSQRHDVQPLRPLPGYLGPRVGQWPRSELIATWCNAIWTYSRTNLSKPDEDKLVAVQGVTKRIAGFLNDSLYYGFLSSTLPHALCWSRPPESRNPEGHTMDNSSFPSWHFARLNEECLFSEQHTLQHRARGETLPGSMPLLRIIPDPGLDRTLPALPKYLYCLAKTVSLVIKPEPSRPSIERVLPRLNLNHFTTDPSTNHTTISSTFGTGALKVTLDHACQESHLSRQPWTLLPVYITAPAQNCRDGRRSLRILHKGRDVDGEDFMFARRMCCVGLFLQQTDDGTFVRKGMFTCYWRRPRSDLALLLEALRSAKPRSVMIS